MTGSVRASERRIFSRQALALPVVVQLGSCATRTPLASIRGFTRDVSNRSAYFWAVGAFEVGQVLHLSLEIPPALGRSYSLTIQWEAQVIRVDASPQQVGVAVRVLRFETPTVSPDSRPWID